jgi:hypothetical protein
MARHRGVCAEPIPILLRTGYYSFLAPPNLLAVSFPSHYNLIDGAKGFVSLATPARCVLPPRSLKILEVGLILDGTVWEMTAKFNRNKLIRIASI